MMKKTMETKQELIDRENEPSIVGRLRCGCVVAVDLDDTSDHRKEYVSRGYMVSIVPKKEAKMLWQGVQYPCKHMTVQNQRV